MGNIILKLAILLSLSSFAVPASDADNVETVELEEQGSTSIASTDVDIYNAYYVQGQGAPRST